MMRFSETYTKESGKWQQIPGAFWARLGGRAQEEGLKRACWVARRAALRRGWAWADTVTAENLPELIQAAWLEVAEKIEEAQPGESWQRVTIRAASIAAQRHFSEGLALRWTETASKAEAERLHLRGETDRTVFDNAAYNNADLLPQPEKAAQTSAMLEYLADGDELNRAILAGKAAGMTGKELAAHAGITPAAISLRLKAMRERLEAWRLMDR